MALINIGVEQFVGTEAKLMVLYILYSIAQVAGVARCYYAMACMPTIERGQTSREA